MYRLSLSYFRNAFFRVLLPVHCTSCSAVIADKKIPLCPVCISKIERADCDILTRKLQIGKLHPLPFESVYAHWFFDSRGAVQEVHQQLKYGNRPGYGITLGTLLGYGLKNTNPNSVNVDTITAIPLHKKRYLERGYNQSAMLAEGASQALSIPLNVNLLIRKQATRPQTGLSREERQRNVASVFLVKDPHSVKNKHILLVDDVLTTGSTLLSAAQTLYDNGAHKISIAALAFARS